MRSVAQWIISMGCSGLKSIKTMCCDDNLFVSGSDKATPALAVAPFIYPGLCLEGSLERTLGACGYMGYAVDKLILNG